jgi:5'-nucleotidase
MKILVERRSIRSSLFFLSAFLWVLSAGGCGTGDSPGDSSSGTGGASSSSSSGSSTSGGAGGCAGGSTVCGARCVDLQADLANCGVCGKACAAGEVCSNSACSLSCQASLTDCGGICSNLKTDLANCGLCGKACAAGEVCSNSACSLSCQASLTDCDGVCTNLDSDAAHCGLCGKSCAPDEVCSGGGCISNTPVNLQFLNISDWHAQLDPINIGGVDIGGAAVLSAYFKNDRAENPNTITLTAGDAFGASPPLSSFFNEQPAVEAMNLMGVQVDTFGNHNFDRGLTHLQSMINLATYKFASANLDNLAQNLSGVAAPFHILNVGDIKVAIIGITNPDAPDLTFPGNLGSISVADPAASAMAAQAAAKAAGARVFVVIAHLGATLYDPLGDTYSGPLITFAKSVSGFHLIFGDHTDIQVNTVINGALVLENKSRGVTYAKVALKVVPAGGTVSRSVKFVSPVASAVTPDPAVEAMLAPYRANLSAALDAPIGVATDLFVRGNNVERLGEVPIGDLIADAIRLRYGTQLAFINGGGIRAPLPSSYLPANHMLRRTTPGYAPGPPYDLVGGDIYATLPFGNAVVTRSVTGAQLWAMAERGVSALPAPIGAFPQISGFRFTYSLSAPPGARVLTVALADGTPIPNNTAVYTLATVDFLNAGGDGYTMLADGTGTTREVMADVVLDHVKALMTIIPTTDGRITGMP